MGGIGGFLVRAANRRGIVMFVGTNGNVYFFPAHRMDMQLRRLLRQHKEQVKEWLIAEAITGGDDGITEKR